MIAGCIRVPYEVTLIVSVFMILEGLFDTYVFHFENDNN